MNSIDNINLNSLNDNNFNPLVWINTNIPENSLNICNTSDSSISKESQVISNVSIRQTMFKCNKIASALQSEINSLSSSLDFVMNSSITRLPRTFQEISHISKESESLSTKFSTIHSKIPLLNSNHDVINKIQNISYTRNQIQDCLSKIQSVQIIQKQLTYLDKFSKDMNLQYSNEYILQLSDVLVEIDSMIHSLNLIYDISKSFSSTMLSKVNMYKQKILTAIEEYSQIALKNVDMVNTPKLLELLNKFNSDAHITVIQMYSISTAQQCIKDIHSIQLNADEFSETINFIHTVYLKMQNFILERWSYHTSFYQSSMPELKFKDSTPEFKQFIESWIMHVSCSIVYNSLKMEYINVPQAIELYCIINPFNFELSNSINLNTTSSPSINKNLISNTSVSIDHERTSELTTLKEMQTDSFNIFMSLNQNFIEIYPNISNLYIGELSKLIESSIMLHTNALDNIELKNKFQDTYWCDIEVLVRHWFNFSINILPLQSIPLFIDNICNVFDPFPPKMLEIVLISNITQSLLEQTIDRFQAFQLFKYISKFINIQKEFLLCIHQINDILIELLPQMQQWIKNSTASSTLKNMDEIKPNALYATFYSFINKFNALDTRAILKYPLQSLLSSYNSMIEKLEDLVLKSLIFPIHKNLNIYKAQCVWSDTKTQKNEFNHTGESNTVHTIHEDIRLATMPCFIESAQYILEIGLDLADEYTHEDIIQYVTMIASGFVDKFRCIIMTDIGHLSHGSIAALQLREDIELCKCCLKDSLLSQENKNKLIYSLDDAYNNSIKHT